LSPVGGILTNVKPPRLLFIPTALLLAFFSSDLSSAVSQSKAPAGKTAAKAPAATASKKQSSSKAPASSSASKKSKGKKRTTARRPATPKQPDEQRIREIQQALNEKGYNVEVNGVWGPQSVEALKKFQEAQNINNLTGRGKLDSLTLIALGLGPRREPPPPPPAAEPKAPMEGKIQ